MSTDVDVRDGAASFVAKWRARWPEWELGMVFVPAAQRPLVEAWFTLLQELTDAAWGGADPTPGLAKLAWWQEELGGWSKGARRHPLGALLQPRSAVPWLALGRALPDLRALRGRDADAAAEPHGAGDVVAGEAFAAAMADCEAALFDGRADADARAVVLRGLLDERSLVQATPMEAIDVADRNARRARPGTRPRGIASAFTSARRRGAGAALPPVRALLAAWRGARSPR
ncbi:phytoene/squalene synthase family protein [Luteimonas sp. MC1750]|uniref:phytoene/squalene synthase family protein n=1 Tax=Luteimonas sp. MC1750 TaxID=2799326 RepID=UPI001F186885|nr:phytoene/squalene synthase family protein [Luteimonas sp. MC1750]